MRIVSVLALAGIGLFATVGHAAEVSGGKVKSGQVAKGVVLSGFTSADPLTNATLVTVPSDQVYVITQFCVDGDKVDLVGSSVGTIIAESFLKDVRCVEFSPGIAVPPGEILECQNSDSSNPRSCVVTGILSKL